MRNAVMLSGAKNDKTPHRVPSAVVLILRFADSILKAQRLRRRLTASSAGASSVIRRRVCRDVATALTGEAVRFLRQAGTW